VYQGPILLLFARSRPTDVVLSHCLLLLRPIRANLSVLSNLQNMRCCDVKMQVCSLSDFDVGLHCDLSVDKQGRARVPWSCRDT
jgi:hypothetical protein